MWYLYCVCLLQVASEDIASIEQWWTRMPVANKTLPPPTSLSCSAHLCCAAVSRASISPLIRPAIVDPSAAYAVYPRPRGTDAQRRCALYNGDVGGEAGSSGATTYCVHHCCRVIWLFSARFKIPMLFK